MYGPVQRSSRMIAFIGARAVVDDRPNQLKVAVVTSVIMRSQPPGDQPERYYELMPWPDRIIVDPEILAGKPVIRGTRLAVEFILELLAAGRSENEILANYPGLTREDILACLCYASYLAHEYKAYPIPA